MGILNKVSIVFCIIIVFTILSACEQIDAQKLGTHSIAKDRSHLVNPNIGVATFAGGCFWCTEADFDKVPGVLSTTSGYIGGELINPTYDQISALYYSRWHHGAVQSNCLLHTLLTPVRLACQQTEHSIVIPQLRVSAVSTHALTGINSISVSEIKSISTNLLVVTLCQVVVTY